MVHSPRPITDPIAVGETIVTELDAYEVEKILGSGSFGTVSLCLKTSTNQKVALKTVESDPTEEATTLWTLMDQGGAHAHIVEWFCCFESRGYFLLEFELLNMSLLDYVVKNGPFQLKQLRPMLQQMGTALSFLQRQGIVHMDLKHDNIMIVNSVSRPVQIKLIDFGLARHVSQLQTGDIVQTRPHRAPEVFLGIPFDEAIDMWSVGCIIMELFLGYYLFLEYDDDDEFRQIINTLGLPSYELLERGWYTLKYLTHKYNRWIFR